MVTTVVKISSGGVAGRLLMVLGLCLLYFLFFVLDNPEATKQSMSALGDNSLDTDICTPENFQNFQQSNKRVQLRKNAQNLYQQERQHLTGW